MKKIVKRFIPLFVLVSFVLFWHIASKIVGNPLFVPSPTETLKMFFQLVSEGNLLKHAISSFMRITMAVSLGGVIAIPLAMLISQVKSVEVLLNPVLGFLKYIPITAFSPILMLIQGIGEDMKITLIFIAVFLQFLPILINLFSDVDIRILETAQSMGLSRLRMIGLVIAPYTLPEVLRNLITQYGIGWTYVIIAEVTNANWGLGHLMYVGSARGNTPMVFAALFTIIIINTVFDKVGIKIVKKLFPWRYKK